MLAHLCNYEWHEFISVLTELKHFWMLTKWQRKLIVSWNYIRTEKYLSSERVPMNKTIQHHRWSERFQFFFWSGAVPIFKWISVIIFKASLQISCVFLFSLYFSMTSSSAANRSAYTIEEKTNSQYLTECVENYRKTEKKLTLFAPMSFIISTSKSVLMNFSTFRMIWCMMAFGTIYAV